MTIPIYFYVPNYKNDISILIVKNQRIIESINTESQELIKNIDRTKLTGIKIISQDGINIFYKNSEFYIEATTNKLDITGRPAIIGIDTKVPTLSSSYNVEDWIFDICNNIQNFSTKVELSIQEKHLDLIRSSLPAIYYRNQRKKLFLYLGKLALALILPILIAWIIQGFFVKINIITIGILISINNIIVILFIKNGGK
ncbi:hypothetical protein [Nostoc sp. CCY 9925]|uniref:hypothetical protein n=1 Tax=Nostoc sp. CCY 9925 TaxID=3103865 RepID=UPI0039C6EF81